MVHREDIEGYPGSLVDLAGEVGDLRYDALAGFLRELADKLAADGAADADRARHRLAAALRDGATGLAAAAAAINRAWAISAPHMGFAAESRVAPDRRPPP
jgi:hypothetical protein